MENLGHHPLRFQPFRDHLREFDLVLNDKDERFWLRRHDLKTGPLVDARWISMELSSHFYNFLILPFFTPEKACRGAGVAFRLVPFT